MKKSQVTVFIIIGIIIIVVIALFLIFRARTGPGPDGGISPVIKPIYGFVEECIKETGEDAVEIISLTGGYFIPLEPYVDGTSIYFNKGSRRVPTKETLEQEISEFVSEMLIFCTRNFENFPDFSIEDKEITVNSDIESGKVIFNVRYLLSVSKDNKTFQIEDFETEVAARLNTIHNTASEIANNHVNENSICINCIYDLTQENDLYIEMNDYDNETIIFTIIDKNIKINNKDAVYKFAVRQ
jgi:hypothetical protein